MKKVVIRNSDGSQEYPANLKKLTDTRYLAVPDFSSGTVGVDSVDSDDASSTFLSEGGAVYDINGRLIRTISDSRDTLSDLPKGIYIIKGNGKARKVRI